MSKARGAKRRAKINKIAAFAYKAAKLTPLGAVATGYATQLKRNKKKMQKFVADQGGIIPSENLEELAVQTAQVRAQKIKEIQEDPTNEADTPEEAATEFEEQQADDLETEEFEGDADAFTEEALGAILGVAKGAVAKVKRKRLSQGKKFLGKTAAQWAAKGKGIDAEIGADGNLNISGLSNKNSNDPLSAAIADARKGAIDFNMKKYLPWVLIALVAGIFIFGSKKMFK